MKNDLREIALAARERAYAPYSHFRVGAALLTKSGAVFSGCNIENISYSLTICAERVCVWKAIEAGETGFEAITIVADSQRPTLPCGACRQVLAEFSSNLEITCWNLSGERYISSLDELLPLANQGLDVLRGT